MTDTALGRLLSLVKKELSADDARIELGGRPPTSASAVWCPIADGRLVALFDAPPSDAAMLQRRLSVLLASFEETTAEAGNLELHAGTRNVQARLDETLSDLAVRAGATLALVCDVSAPLIWGCSRGMPGSRGEAVDVVDRIARDFSGELAPKLRSSHNHVLRLSQNDDGEYLARLFGGTYAVVLYFESVLSEPVAVGALLHAVPVIERLVVSLPPVDPTPGGRVIRLSRA